ncbi:two-component system OmpR family response regulator [Brevundimonas vesicularis]|uniref:response regulator n=1 Tax=Brevundimonas vesicularis TaxID=41276 RepID=UPI00278B3356|nr:response regulator transcription factor [Brevundimonas vesicularis]MDQ1192013.1 two-component system OmpR family response regulator [Brevundimonas vesicularis]
MSQTSAAPVLLVVDDDREIRNLLSDHLEQHGFRTVKAADGRAMKAALEAGPVDLVVLDLNLPDEDGLSLCRGIRAASKTPVIILTARGDPIDRIVGLEMGADDYMAKPFEPRELVARIRTVLRRTGGEATTSEGRHADFSGWSLDIATRALTAPDGRLAPLSGADFDLLHALVRNGGKPLSRERIRALSTVADADDRAVDLRVSRLRQKLGDDAKAPALIRTVRSLGYMLAGPVTWRA